MSDLLTMHELATQLSRALPTKGALVRVSVGRIWYDASTGVLHITGAREEMLKQNSNVYPIEQGRKK